MSKTSVPSCPAIVTIENRNTKKVTVCKGRYYGDGRILCDYDGRLLLCDPDRYDDDDPKRMFDYREDTWTSYRIKIITLDSVFIKKNR